MVGSALLACACVAIAAPATPSVTVDIDAKGGYSLEVNGHTWFKSGATFYTSGHTTKTTADGSLTLGSTTTGKGADALGPFTATTLSWDGGSFVTEFRQYADAVVFEQRFPNAVSGASKNASHPLAERDFVSTGFPTLSHGGGEPLGFLQFAGLMTGSEYQYGRISKGGAVSRVAGGNHDTDAPIPDRSPNPSVAPSEPPSPPPTLPPKAPPTSLTGVSGFGPACFFSEDLEHSVVISAFSQFMAASSGNLTGSTDVAYGLQGSVTAIPAGYSLSFIVSASAAGGINSAFEEWGDKLLATYDKHRARTWEDQALNYLGYSTDNGAFYYYQTENGTPGQFSGGKSYEDTLIDVKRYADSEGIPYKYILLDSWWYYKGQGGGVKEWVGKPSIFPHGNQFVRNQTGWPQMGHNRYWAIDNVYAKQNGGDYDFVVEKQADNPEFKDFAWPEEQRFWDDLLYNSSKWGLFMYEQDWLDTEYDSVVHLNTNASAARTWLLQMGTAAARNDLTIQYCMAWPRHIMQSVELPAVTNARASYDYHPDNSTWVAGKPQFPGNQWKPLGTTGIFAWAVAIAPTKDNFWSTDVQTGTSYGDFATVRERYNRLNSAVSTLSKGPVAPSDKIGRSDAGLILKSCAADGKLLQGDRPAMTLDSLHAERAFGVTSPAADEVWATSTDLDGGTYTVVIGATLAKGRTVAYGADLGLSAGTAFVAYEANATSKMVLGSSLQLKACGKWDFQLWAIAPVLGNGWALLGEPSKWVPVSAARFSALSYVKQGTATSASVVATGHVGEQIEVAWLAPGSTEPTVVRCTIPGGSKVRVQVTTATGGASCLDVQ